MSILSIVGGSQTYSAASGGKVYAYNSLSTAFTQVAPANTARRRLTFHNPGTVDMYVGPSFTANSTTGALSAATPNTAALGGTFVIYANGGTLVVEGECQTAWLAFSKTAGINPLTVMDSNIA